MTDHRPLEGKIVAITGASGGIGAACAGACARGGAKGLVLIGRSMARLNSVAEALTETCADVLVRRCDVTDTKEVQHAIQSVSNLEVLINSAGANQPEPFVLVSEDTLEWLWRLNVNATVFSSQAAVNRMIADGTHGVIINISSQMGHVGAPLRTIYSATKHAVEGFTKALAIEVAPHGIRVVSIASTFVRTAMTAAQLDDPQVGPALLAKIPLGRFAQPDDVAAAAVFAASNSAAMISGSSILVDGGWTAQ